jgi:hypothetical protein
MTVDYIRHLNTCIESREKSRLIKVQVVGALCTEYREHIRRAKELRAQLKIYKESEVINLDAALPENMIMCRCPTADCKGLVNGNWVCGICKVNVCSKCQVALASKEAVESHVCDENILKSLAAIKKETRPCPKCKTNIFKAEGCNQMWCTNCMTAFEWVTGNLIVGGFFHNPHHREWLDQRRASGGGGANNADAIGGINDNAYCEEFRDANTTLMTIEGLLASLREKKHDLSCKMLDVIKILFRSMNFLDVSNGGFKRSYAPVKEIEYVELGVKFMNINDDAEWIRRVRLLDKKKEFHVEVNELKTAFCVCFREIIARFCYNIRPPKNFSLYEFEVLLGEVLFEIFQLSEASMNDLHVIEKRYNHRILYLRNCFDVWSNLALDANFAVYLQDTFDVIRAIAISLDNNDAAAVGLVDRDEEASDSDAEGAPEPEDE